MINKNQARNSIEIVDGEFIVGVKSAKVSNNTLKKLYANWITEKAQNIFEDKVQRVFKETRCEGERSSHKES